jgi:hypothetical protein
MKLLGAASSVRILAVTAASLVAVYLVLMVTTIFFAAWETQLARSMDDSRERIHKVEYVVAARMQGLTYVSR